MSNRDVAAVRDALQGALSIVFLEIKGRCVRPDRPGRTCQSPRSNICPARLASIYVSDIIEIFCSSLWRGGWGTIRMNMTTT